MSLHTFAIEHREEILDGCRRYLPECLSVKEEVEHDVAVFFDGLLRTLGKQPRQPVAAASSEISAVAARLGEQQQRAGFNPANVPMIFGAISKAIGEVGERYGLAIDADEYQLFTHCIDAGIATSIENFWNGE